MNKIEKLKELKSAFEASTGGEWDARTSEGVSERGREELGRE